MQFTRLCLAIILGCWLGHGVCGQIPIPGTGKQVVGDDFEDPSWAFFPNLPKSSHEQDERIRQPAGKARNGRWGEGLLRGCPDYVARVTPPAGGIAGSSGALEIRSRLSGIPGQLAGKSMQDDLIMVTRPHKGFDVSQYPSVVTRIYLPAFEEWEQRNGSMFAFRTEVIGTRRVAKVEGKGLFARTVPSEPEQSWPGIFIQHTPRVGKTKQRDAYLVIRGGPGGDVRGPQIEETGWWTLGMSFTPDGQAHYFARPGVDPLEPADHIYSYFPYNYRVEQLTTLFFDTFNHEDGKTWSTPVIVDDTGLYLNSRTASVARAGGQQR